MVPTICRHGSSEENAKRTIAACEGRYPLAPHVLLLNQRSGDVADFRDWFDGTDFPVVDFTKLTKNRRIAGITITAFGELVAPLLATESQGDDEWEF